MILADRELDRRACLRHARGLVIVGRKRAHGLGDRCRHEERSHRGGDANRLGGGAIWLAHFDLLGVGFRCLANVLGMTPLCLLTVQSVLSPSEILPETF